MTIDNQKESERLFLLQRLTSQKDALLKASQEIEEYVKKGDPLYVER